MFTTAEFNLEKWKLCFLSERKHGRVKCLTNPELIRIFITLAKICRKLIGLQIERSDRPPEFLKSGSTEQDFQQTVKQEDDLNFYSSLQKTRASKLAYFLRTIPGISSFNMPFMIEFRDSILSFGYYQDSRNKQQMHQSRRDSNI